MTSEDRERSKESVASSRMSSGNGIKHTPTKRNSRSAHAETMLETVMLAVNGLIRGVVDSLNFFVVIAYALRCEQILHLLMNCLALNAILFVSIYVISILMTPLQPTGMFAVVWEAIFSVTWVVPMYAVTQILGLTWYEDLYKTTVREKCLLNNIPLPEPRSQSFRDIGEWAMKFIVTLIYGILGALISFIPVIGSVLSFIMSSWLHAFYCFDYRFLEQGVTNSKTGKFQSLKLSHVIKLFEFKWAYFLGYGSTHIFMRLVLENYLNMSMFARLAVCSSVFAINVVSTVDAAPGPDTMQLKIPIFSPLFKWIADYLMRWKKEGDSHS